MRLSPETMLLLAQDGDDLALQVLLQWDIERKTGTLWFVPGANVYMLIKLPRL